MGHLFLNPMFNLVLASTEQGEISLLPPDIFKWAIGIGILLALGSIIYAGIVYMVSAGNESYQKEAMERIKGAVFGLILLISGWLILYTLNPDILRSGTIKIPEVSVDNLGDNLGEQTIRDIISRVKPQDELYCDVSKKPNEYCFKTHSYEFDASNQNWVWRPVKECFACDNNRPLCKRAATSKHGITASIVLRCCSEKSGQRGAPQECSTVREISYYEDKDVSQKRKALIIEGYPLNNPVPGARVTSGVGWRRAPVAIGETSIKKGKCHFHLGVDLAANCGTPVYATRSGKVNLNTIWNVYTYTVLGYGNQVIISHADGFTTSYSHLSGFAVKNGQKVNEGDIIGYVGKTGSATGCHLHYEVRKDKKVVDINELFGAKAGGC